MTCSSPTLPPARLRAGSVGSIEAQAAFAVASANRAYQNSGIATRARLVHTMEVNYTEVGGDLVEDLRRLEILDDGFLDEIHAARDLYQADLVSLFINGPPAGTTGRFFVGLATFAVDYGDDGQLRGEPEGGFSVVAPSYDVATTFPHEVGHNFGCQHDRENTIVDGINYGPGIFPYSYGWRFPGQDKRQYRDLMAYDPGTVIPYFSNPAVLYAGAPTGVADYADNARTMNATASLIANLRKLPTVSVSATLPQALESPLTPGRFTFARTGPVDRPLTVNLRYNPLYEDNLNASQLLPLATDGADYAHLPEQIIIPAGSASADLEVIPLDDDLSEGPERVRVLLQPGAGYIVTTRAGADRASVVIRDTETTVSVTARAPTVLREPLTAGQFVFTRTGSLEAPLTVACAVNSLPLRSLLGTDDYTLSEELVVSGLTNSPPGTLASGILAFPAGVASAAVTLTPVAVAPTPSSSFPRSDYHSVGLRILDSDQYKALVPSASISILDRAGDLPARPRFAISATVPTVSFTASASNGAKGEFQLTRVGQENTYMTVNLSLKGTATLGPDYNVQTTGNGSFGGAPPFKLAFPANVTTLPLSIIPRTPDNQLTKSVVATLEFEEFGDYIVDADHATATVTLLGTPIVNVTATGPEARVSSDLGPVNGEFTFTREGDLAQNLVVNYATSGSATGGVQYKALKGVVTIPAGSAEARVRIKPLKNGPAGKATVKVTLKAGGNYVLGAAARAEVKVFGGG